MSVFGKVISVDVGSDDLTVIDYVPKAFPIKLTPQASDFTSSQSKKKSDFLLNDLVAGMTGIAEQRRIEQDTKIEQDILQKLKGIEEKAYAEAYDLGLVEGSEKGFQEKQTEIEKRLKDLDSVLHRFESMTTEIFKEKENQLLKLITSIATKMAIFEIKSNPESIKDLIHSMVEKMQSEERVLIRMSPSDVEFLRQLKNDVSPDFESLVNVKIEDDESVSPGGCMFESTYGAIDATVERRVENVWKAIEERLPRVQEGRVEVTPSKFETKEAILPTAKDDNGDDSEPESESTSDEGEDS